MALRFLLRFPAFSQKERNGPFFTFPWRFRKFLTALQRRRHRGGLRGHSYCFGRSRWGGPLRVLGAGLPNGLAEFSISRLAAR